MPQDRKVWLHHDHPVVDHLLHPSNEKRHPAAFPAPRYPADFSCLAPVVATFKTVWRDKNIVWFLAAYFFYIDGVDTIFKMATAVGSDFGLSMTHLMLILLLVQAIAVPFSILFGRLAQRIGTKYAIGIALGIYVVICIWGYFMQRELDFWILAFLVGTAQGGIQL